MRARLLLGAALAAASCGQGASPEAPPVVFDTARARVISGADTVPLLVEVARTDAQRARGLQQRERLDEGSGMVFVYDSVQAADYGFWMWRTLIPLDLAYLARDGEVLAVRTMTPCESPVPEWCREEALPYRPGVPWTAALEVGRGWLARHGVGPGARVVVEGELPRPGADP